MSGFRDLPDLWLDVTRLLTRIGRGALTGIDRVEVAYLTEALEADAKFLCRTTRGFLLLDQTGGHALLDLSNGAPMGRADWLSCVSLRGHKPRHKAEAILRQHAIARCRPSALPKLVQDHATPACTYVNVGHSNLSEVVLSTFSDHPGTCVVLIHDLIPLTHPAYVADGLPDRFAGRIDRVRRYADLVICNSAVTQSDLSAHWSGQTDRPPQIVAHLGVTPRALSDDLDREPGHFVMLGTVEPRKNHALMLDVWEFLAQEMPRDKLPTLHIIGAIGWKVDGLVNRLVSDPLFGQKIFLNGPHGTLDDAVVQDHLARATALLFPSLVEGYGYPPLEAALAGATPICSNLPVFQETLGDSAVYVDSNDAHSWLETIKQHFSGTPVKPELTMLQVPTWAEHFEKVADAIPMTSKKGRQ